MKCRIIWRKGIADYNGVFCGFEYKTDIIDLPSTANAFQFPDFITHGFLPEATGCEWIKDDEKE